MVVLARPAVRADALAAPLGSVVDAATPDLHGRDRPTTVGRGQPSGSADVGGMSPVPCRCGRGEPSPGADVAAVCAGAVVGMVCSELITAGRGVVVAYRAQFARHRAAEHAMPLALGPQNYYVPKRLLGMCVLHGVNWTQSSASSAINERRMEEEGLVWGHTGYENCWLDVQLCQIGTQRL